VLSADVIVSLKVIGDESFVIVYAVMVGQALRNLRL
jgi:hypothetical protein